MNLLVLLLGAISVFNPFVGLILTMIYIILRMRKGIASPLRILGLFFVFPVLMALFMRQEPGFVVAASDATWGVGICAMLFLHSLHRGSKLSAALVHCALLIIGYGIVRHLVFGGYLLGANEQALAEMKKLFPQIFQSLEVESTQSIIRDLIPSSWIIPQLVSLFIGVILFQQLAGGRFVWKEISFPKYYNFLILAILPLYFFPEMHLVFVNTLLSLCVLPVIQGIGVLLHLTSSLNSNLFMMMLLTILIIFNLILVALIGFADIWLDFRKLKLKGTYS